MHYTGLDFMHTVADAQGEIYYAWFFFNDILKRKLTKINKLHIGDTSQYKFTKKSEQVNYAKDKSIMQRNPFLTTIMLFKI